MSEEKVFELMTKMYTEMQKGFKHLEGRLTGVEGRLTGVEDRLTGVEDRLTTVEKTVIKIEIEHGQKLSALFDGYTQNSEKLDRIESEIAKHEEFILKRIK